MVRGPFLALCAVGAFAAGAAAQSALSEVTWVQAANFVAAYDRSGNLASFSPNVLPGGGWGIALDGYRRVWVSNYSNGQNTVSCIEPWGALVGTYPAGPAVTSGSSVGPLAIDAQNNVYVADPRQGGTGQITKLDPMGNFVQTIQTFGAMIRSLAIDVNGNLWALLYAPSGGKSSVQQFTPTGTYIRHLNIQGFVQPNTIYADEWGRLAVAHYPSSLHVTFFNVNDGVQGAQLFNASGGCVGVAPDGRIWVTSSYGPNFAIGVAGSGQNGQFLNAPGGNSGFLTGVAFDAYGDTWMSQSLTSGGNVVLRKLDAAGNTVFTIPVGPQYGIVYNQGDMTGMVRARTIDPNGDMDADGFPNLVEVVGRSSPLDPGSIPVLSSVLSAPVLGNTLSINVSVPRFPGAAYFMPFSSDGTAFPLSVFVPGDRRSFPISPILGSAGIVDPVWELSVGPTPFTALLFPNTFGTLDSTGSATINVNLPPVPSLQGFTIHGAFCTISTTLPSPIGALSQRFTFVLQ